MLRWHQLRWRTGRFFYALKVGTRIGDRKLDEADGPRKCLALNAITAFRVRDLTFLARERPDDPARMYVEPDGTGVLFALAASLGPTPPRGPPDLDVGTLPVLTAGLAGFHLSKRQPMPGNRKLWQGRSRFREGSWDIRPCVPADADRRENSAGKSKIQAATAAALRPCQESKTRGSPGPVSAAPSGSAERVPTVFRRTVRKPGFCEIGGVNQLYAHCHEAQHVVFYSRDTSGHRRCAAALSGE